VALKKGNFLEKLLIEDKLVKIGMSELVIKIIAMASKIAHALSLAVPRLQH
jgi:hypothetical protein